MNKKQDSEKISLALSGGGHRATLFSLGVFAYLADAGLTKKIDAISSVSGGSITNGVIAAFGVAQNQAVTEIGRKEWNGTIAKAAKLISGHANTWKFSALGLTSLAVFFASLLFFGSEQFTSIKFLVSTWIMTTVVLLLLRGVYGCGYQLLGAWIIFTGLSYGSIFFLDQDVSWHQIHTTVVLTIIILSILGSYGGGSFWGHPMTWFLFSFSVWGILLGLHLMITNYASAVVFLRSSIAEGIYQPLTITKAIPGHFLAGGCLFFVSLLGLSLRNSVADRAFNRFLTKAVGISKIPLGDLRAECQHVFCATAVEHNTHLYFTKSKAMYLSPYGRGWTYKGRWLRELECAELPLSSAIQMSAAFPGGFPYKNVRLKVCPDGDETQGLLVTDGGVFDNSGTSWFLDLPVNTQKLKNLIVVDGLRDETSKAKWPHYVPILQDFGSVFGVIGAALNAVGDGRRTKTLVGQLNSQDDYPCMVHVSASMMPENLAINLLNESEALTGRSDKQRLDLLEAAASINVQLQRIELPIYENDAPLKKFTDFWLGIRRIKQHTAVSDESNTPRVSQLIKALFKQKNQSQDSSGRTIHVGNLPRALSEPFKVPTTFRPLGEKQSADCLRLGYFHAMHQLHLITRGAAPLIERDTDDFAKLANGHALGDVKYFRVED